MGRRQGVANAVGVGVGVGVCVCRFCLLPTPPSFDPCFDRMACAWVVLVDAVIIGFTWLKLDSWDNEQFIVNVDGVKKYGQTVRFLSVSLSAVYLRVRLFMPPTACVR